MNEKLNASYFFDENKSNNRLILERQDKCDKYDYLAAVICGAIGGLIDIFLVGSPMDSTLQTWSDKQVDNAVNSFAKIMGFKSEGNADISRSINFLEQKFKVNYDQRYSSDVGNLFNMTTRDHHIKSLSHSPDIIGLFFSLLNQFTSTSSFISNGQVITINTQTYELQGRNFIARLFCGITNWIGHIMSDISGSSSTRMMGGRGSGLVMPFYELFQFCGFGNLKVGEIRYTLSEIATSAFKAGYDFRFGLNLAIPVIITDLLIRLVWSLRRYFQYKYPLKECIPTQKHNDLRIMLLFGNGTLCFMDTLDAGIRSGGNALMFFMRLNLIAWFRFVWLIVKEVCIKTGISNILQTNIEAYKRINTALTSYLNELKNIDIELFKKEVENYNKISSLFSSTTSQEELNKALLTIFDEMSISKPWKGDFDEHMSDKNKRLVFE